MSEEFPSAKFQLRVKQGTRVITAVAFVALLLHDWGPGTVFSGIRPALDSVLGEFIPDIFKDTERKDIPEAGKPEK